MSEVLPRNVLVRVGGRTLMGPPGRTGCGLLAASGFGRKPVELPYTFSRADASTCATYVDRDGILRKAAANVPRIEWVDLDGDGIRETPGILLEGSRAQGWQFTEDFSNAIWQKTNCTISVNATTGPDGTASADGIVTNNGTFNALVFQDTPALTDSTQQSTFFIVKPGNKTIARVSTRDKGGTVRSSWVNLSTGAVGTKDASHTIRVVTGLANGFTRIDVMWPSATGATTPQGYLAPADSDGSSNTTGDGATINLYAYCGSLEVDKAFPSSYIPRTGAGAVTRAADSFTLPFNFGPMDLTVLSRIARPVHADAVGDIGMVPGICGLGYGGNPHLRHVFVQANRQLENTISTVSSAFSSAGINAGTQITGCGQYRTLTTGGRVKTDAGAGFGSEAGPATAFSAFFSQTLRVGAYNNAGNTELYGVLLELVFGRGLFSLSEMLAIP